MTYFAIGSALTIGEYIKEHKELVILIITGSLYSMAFVYKMGFFGRLNVPKNLIESGPNFLFNKIHKVIMALILLYLLLYISDYYIIEYFKPFGFTENDNWKVRMEKISSESDKLYINVAKCFFFVTGILIVILFFAKIAIRVIFYILFPVFVLSILFLSYGLEFYMFSIAIISVAGIICSWLEGYIDADVKIKTNSFDFCKDKPLIDYYNGRALVAREIREGKVVGPFVVYDVGQSELKFRKGFGRKT